MKKYLFFLFSCLSTLSAFPQSVDTSHSGAINGVIWDSAHSIVLRTATVAIYDNKSGNLIAYRLTNNYGEFELNKLPVGQSLQIIASFVGYKTSKKVFEIPVVSGQLAIGKINMAREISQLKEVVIGGPPPPITMNGDTLEFNAGAFKLDPNAQTEDLLKALPGITVWSDGTITVNGREVKSVLVNGKPFFGGDSRVATQNIPKSIVEKVQVYQREKSPNHPSDSTSEINIKLKKGKDRGYFGKLSGGYGSGRHYEGDGSLNIFNSRTQIGVAAATNNVNKVADDINFLLRNNTFKGTGANVEYQSNFNIEGLNKYTSAGAILQHDFIPRPDYYNNNRLTGTYFFKHNDQQLEQETQTTTTLNDSSFYSQLNIVSGHNTKQSQDANVKYDRLRNGNNLKLEANFRNERLNSTSITSTRILDQYENYLSEYKLSLNDQHHTNDVSVRALFVHKPQSSAGTWLSLYELDYKLNIKTADEENMYISDYKVINNGSQHQHYNRLYNNSDTRIQNNLTFKLPEFGTLFFGHYKFLGISTGLQNETKVVTGQASTNVKDKDSLSKQYAINDYLTNGRHEINYTDNVALTFIKKVSHVLSNRYEKYYTYELDLGVQYYNLNSYSDKAFQEFSRSYFHFIPKVDISLFSRAFGEFTNRLNAGFNTIYSYPSVLQLSPLVDSINPNFVMTGNINLKEQRTDQISVSFNHESENGRHTFTYQIRAEAGTARNYFANQSLVDSLGRTIYSLVNANGYRFAMLAGEIRKAFKIQHHQIQLIFSPAGRINHTPGRVNGVLNYYDNLSLVLTPNLTYSYKDLVNVQLAYSRNYQQYRNKGDHTYDLSSLISKTEVSGSVKLAKKITLNSNTIYTSNRYNGVGIRDFTIWNASAVCRLFKDNSAEIKVSALDILHQNKGLINYGVNNSITQGTVNALRQYFMVTLSYFPRKFGKDITNLEASISKRLKQF